MYTKGEWRVVDSNHEDVYGNRCFDVETPDDFIATLDSKANAQLIASAPTMHGQLKTGVKALTEVLDIAVEVAKTCSPEIAEQMVAAQSYLSGVIAGNEIALAKAEGK